MKSLRTITISKGLDDYNEFASEQPNDKEMKTMLMDDDVENYAADVDDANDLFTIKMIIMMIITQEIIFIDDDVDDDIDEDNEDDDACKDYYNYDDHRNNHDQDTERSERKEQQWITLQFCFLVWTKTSMY